MKTFDKLVYSLWEIVSNFNITDDNEYPKAWLEDAVLSVHNTLVREAFNNNRLSQGLYMLHSTLETNQVSEDMEIDGVTVKSRSGLCYSDLPPLVDGVGWSDIEYFGPKGYGTNYSRRSPKSLLSGRSPLWTSDKPSYTVIGNKALISAENSIVVPKYLSVEALFRDPRTASSYKDDMAFPTPSEYKLELLCLKHLLSSKGVVPDLISDAQRMLTPGTASKRREKRTVDEDS